MISFIFCFLIINDNKAVAFSSIHLFLLYEERHAEPMPKKGGKNPV